jgi:AcrR family transcriptional regulator
VQTGILDAALVLVVSGGAAAARMRAVARGAGMSPMALYTYYPSRRAVLDALAERETASLVAGQKRVEKRAATGEIATSMREALLLYPRFEREHPEIFALAWLPSGEPAEDPARARQRLRATVEHLARLVRIGIERGAFRKRDPVLAASTVLSIVTSPLVLYHTGRVANPRLRDRLVREVLDAAMGYLGARVSSSPKRAT